MENGSPSTTSPSYTPNKCPTTPGSCGPSTFTDSDILKDVVAYVEVRTESDNRSGAIKRILQRLGARVEDKFTNDVTHCIFKEGKKKTKNKAEKLGIHLLSVRWVHK